MCLKEVSSASILEDTQKRFFSPRTNDFNAQSQKKAKDKPRVSRII